MFGIKSRVIAKRGVIAVGLFAAIVTSSATAQQQSGGVPSEPQSQLSNPVEQYLFGQQLYEFGKTNSDILSVIAAAGIVAKSTPRTIASRDSSGSGGAVTKPVANLPTLDDMLATAKSLAGQNRTLLALIDDISSGSGKGFIPGGGPSQWTFNRYDKWGPFDFEGGKSAAVAVQAAPGLAPVITVTDEYGTKVCETSVATKTIKDKDGSDVEIYACDWAPIWQGKFNVQVTGSTKSNIAYTMIVQ